MKLNSIQTLIGTATTTACLLSMTGVAQAGSFYNGWNYARDYSNDGTGGYEQFNGRIASGYEMYGMAVHQDGDTITVGINTNLGLEGRHHGPAKDDNIGWGDFLFSVGGEQYGIHFAETNDSFGRGLDSAAADAAQGTNALGLYKDITTKNVTAKNSGWSTIKKHDNETKNRTANVQDRNAGIKSFGDLESSELSYYNSWRSAPTSIKSGTKVENDNFQLLNQSQLSGLGLDFGGAFGVGSNTLGATTFGFSFTKTPEMLGEFVAHLFAECTNDGMAIQGTFEEVPSVPVPEPTAVAGLALVGLMFAGSKLRQHS
ncbi:PEP-CTERM sorting domain-containing protein [Roseofilum sp. BLCC_M91]|uniref:PEP-CTERM sorting domain-containing protein n=1 Tax=Roseofilum halophilum BLCC-M91 TaxID=3022259 RepID=A0ABT7BMX0_9CYAN|nr:XDD3 family exosortase-dependent surface protein [Roseofilum halophilum]MDJ1180552.1 PEP-CTERM sorting domain-containing protein [Roseofilum halophilum BLCC-M91]